MLETILFFSLLLTTGFSTVLTNSSRESLAAELFNYKGEPMVYGHVEIDLEHFENHSITRNINDYDVPFNVSRLDLSNVTVHDAGYNLSAALEHQSDEDANMQTSVAFALEGGKCVYEFWDIVNAVWQLGYDVYKATRFGDCSVQMSSLGGFYYKYYPVSDNCESTIEQKTVVGAIQYIISKLEGKYIRNIYSCTVNHHGTWHGTIIIGPSNKVWYSNIGSTEYKGCWDKGCAELQSPYSYNSKQEGA
ncbi:hypothetical protein C6P45_002940 [Maudiozyma exigua]|uniref:Secreted protein CSS2 C-terminal domain-containing protein n=1 Tax=Maudiozyma exigua TaxID=34358 RepID=A0A9P6WEC3_MAUEX|nr:hypothetical protein C6P45_002940 [Kazachstania exigua]